jgi:hypothetical protein
MRCLSFVTLILALGSSAFAQPSERGGHESGMENQNREQLRTPLTAVLGWAHTLRVAHADRERVQRAAAAIERNAEAQRRLIEDLLDVAGIAAGRVRMSPSHIVIDRVVEAVLDAVAPQAEEKRIRVSTSFEEQGLTVYADPQRLEQIVWNLVWNAVKDTPESVDGHVAICALVIFGALRLTPAASGRTPGGARGAEPQLLHKGSRPPRGSRPALESGEALANASPASRNWWGRRWDVPAGAGPKTRHHSPSHSSHEGTIEPGVTN